MKSLLCISLFALLSTSFSFPDIRYVSKTGSSTPPFLTWETASDSIQKVVNICNMGDTIIVANGVYAESLYVTKNINLIGTSSDSTIIKGSPGTYRNVIEFFQNNSTIQNFTITQPGVTGISLWISNVKVKNCVFKNLLLVIRPYQSSLIFENILAYDVNRVIYDWCPSDTCNSLYENNIIFSKDADITPAVWFDGGYPIFINNILTEEGNTWTGVYGDYLRGFIVKNNLITGYKTEGINSGLMHGDSAYIINNTLVNNGWNQFGKGSILTVTGRNKIKNNVIVNSPVGVYSENDTVRADYNLFWIVKKLFKYKVSMGDSNVVADPMFVKDTAITLTSSYDFHLQKYSPAIDKGDPSILDPGGTRSDLGYLGGPGGQDYTYLDLSPRAPVNVTALVYADTVKLKWNKNTEADTSLYRVYRDTVPDFILDSVKIVAAIKDTLFKEIIPLSAKHIYYKITAVDKCNNESHASEEIFINVTEAIEEKSYTVSNYQLYQNYPNPFNPSTTIPYRLKERGNVKLMVYDLKGELVKVLVNKEQESGYYEEQFNGSGLASGIYMYRIEVIGKGYIPVYSDMKKAIIIK